jgi:hypothetical protein
MPREGDAQTDLLPIRQAASKRRVVRRTDRRAVLSPGVLAASLMLSVLHLFNFLNYTVIGQFVNPPVVRSVLLVTFVAVILIRHTKNLPFHLQRSWDMYALCLLALASAAYSHDPSRTLMYGAWLILSVYAGTELAARVRRPDDLVAALCIVLIPVSILTAVVNVTLGPIVESTGRQFGALGSAHVDTAYAMNFVCLFLALRAIPVKVIELPKWLRLVMWAVLAWALYQAVFGLTRSVWLGVSLAFALYLFRRSLTLKSLLGTLGLAVLVVVVIDLIGLGRILPEEVKGRIEVTEQRIEAGYVDPRLEGIRNAYRAALDQPQGTGYAVASSHNSYMNILLNLGWIGAALAVVAIGRSMALVSRAGFGWLLFFAIGCAPLMVHAFFEVQNWPGQANFMPLLLWYALSRARVLQNVKVDAPSVRARYRFIGN